MTKEEIDKLWDELAKKKFVWFDNWVQYDDMLASADEIDGNLVMKNGMAYIFDDEEMSAYEASMDDFAY